MVSNDPQEARVLLEQDAWDAVVCDVRMPGMSGPALYAGACRGRPGLVGRFVFTTGGAVHPQDAEIVASSGCQLLNKPFTRAALLAAVDAACTSR